jgi:hypothetical protein
MGKMGHSKGLKLVILVLFLANFLTSNLCDNPWYGRVTAFYVDISKITF